MFLISITRRFAVQHIKFATKNHEPHSKAIYALNMNDWLGGGWFYQTCSRRGQLAAVHLQEIQDYAICPAEAGLNGVLTAATVATEFVGRILSVNIIMNINTIIMIKR